MTTDSMTLTHLVVPTVHMNGTGRDDLVDANQAVISALTKALDALHRAGSAPNLRDHYGQPGRVQPDGTVRTAYAVAREQHDSRVQRLRAVQLELDHLNETLLDG